MPPPPTAFAGSLVLTGPTGAGKTATALELAEQLGGEIVALDSMTIYRGLDIGTAKPTPTEQARVRHHLLDELDPWQSGSVAWWLDRAATACAEIRTRGKTPIFVGGTPFYLKALLFGLFDSPTVEPAIRAKWEAEAERIGELALHAKLAEVDPKSAQRLHPNDVRRVVRALEVHDATGQPLSEFQTNWNEPAIHLPVAILDWPREELYERINQRVLAMLEAGWLDEARRLLALPQPLSKEAGQALGYSELFAYLSGKCHWAEVVSAIQTRTRQFAKRQLTWFRSLPGARWIAPGSRLIDRVIEFWAEDSVRVRGDSA